ncbi:MAG: hypothetical protein MUP58_00645, partial [Candidatus Nanohaloarchaeota archaeon QJJ-9]|nr:hypothetical protein [Candidatus Nanohaloarchaeota archaeon QJJ-9]
GLKEHIVELVNKMDADRVVIDSISVMGMYTQGAAEVRRRLYELIKHLRREEVTTVITSEAPKGNEDSISRFGVEEFVSDTVVTLHYMGIGGGIFRNIEVPKIRKTDQEKGSFPMEISDAGMKVYMSEEEYAEAQD